MNPSHRKETLRERDPHRLYGRKAPMLGGCVVPTHLLRGYSSVGRALLLHGRCQRFESAYLHPHTNSVAGVFTAREQWKQVRPQGLTGLTGLRLFLLHCMGGYALPRTRSETNEGIIPSAPTGLTGLASDLIS